jgi:hypothetical protein
MVGTPSQKLGIAAFPLRQGYGGQVATSTGRASHFSLLTSHEPVTAIPLALALVGEGRNDRLARVLITVFRS